MTDNKIMEALECCGGDNYEEDCPKCPMHNDGNCNCNLAKYALDLINRQKAEIERLTAIIDRQKDNFDLLDIEHKAIRIEAVKKFAKNLKARIIFNFVRTKRIEKFIDDFVKEWEAGM